jgi:hypothetical protein
MNQTESFKEKVNFNDYTKQCIATKNNKGEIEVWINCACDGIGKDCFKYFIGRVHDGGPCFFKLKMNLTKKECFDVLVNGS